jgi:hypothetical protein
VLEYPILAEYFLLKYSHWLNISCWNILYWFNILLEYLYWQNILKAEYFVLKFCTETKEMFRTEYFVLKHPYWLSTVHWNFLIDWFVLLKYPHWLNICREQAAVKCLPLRDHGKKCYLQDYGCGYQCLDENFPDSGYVVPGEFENHNLCWRWSVTGGCSYLRS